MASLMEIERAIDDVLAAHAATLEQAANEEDRLAIEDGIAKILDGLAHDEADKVDAYGYFFNKCKAEEERLAGLIADLSVRKTAVAGRMRRVKDTLAFVFDFTGKTKVEGHLFIARKRDSVTVEVPEVTLLPKKFRRVVEEPDKKAIKFALDNGEKVKGAKLVPSSSVSVGTR